MRNKSISSQFLLGLGTLALLLPSATLRGQESLIPPGKEVYMGRRIAQTMHFEGAPWLIRNTREREERCSLMLANLGIKPGMTWGSTDDFGYHALDRRVNLYDLNAPILHCLGIDHERLTFKFQGRQYRLTDVHGKVVHEVIV